MKLLVINNLNSGYGEGAVYDFIRSFTHDGDEVCMRATDGTTEVATMLYDATSFDAVIASGGDGTVAAVSYELAGTGIPILPFPAGTANLLALNLQSPNEPHALAKMVRKGLTLDFDLGEMEVGDRKIGFVIMAGAGYDAAIMRDAKPHKRVWGPMAYFSAALANATPQKSKFHLVLDGEERDTEGLGILLVNFAKLQFDLSVTHENLPRDGWLGVVVLKGKSAFDLIPALIGMVLDRDGAHPDRTDSLEIYYAKEVSVSADPPMEVQFDGETVECTTPFIARILPSATRYYVSEEGFEQFVQPEELSQSEN
ncbi:MAG: diacylglycerol kinase family protein [Eggerthellaceae bacterium]|nr:diacylglycerol kinase family protein [Eggerthellaceae bacterium]